MNIVFLKEVKLAKDVWLRGADPEKLKKYRGEFVEQQALFEEHRAAALTGMKKLAEGHQAIDDFISKLKLLADEHKAVSGKYMVQIDAHKGNAAESDAAVAGIDRELSKQILASSAQQIAGNVNHESDAVSRQRKAC